MMRAAGFDELDHRPGDTSNHDVHLVLGRRARWRVLTVSYRSTPQIE
jgi:hypothetical protein